MKDPRQVLRIVVWVVLLCIAVYAIWLALTFDF
jgi:hypothetical protein